MLPSMAEEERAPVLASRCAAIAAGVLIISTLLPWVSVTFFSAATLNGVRSWEGRITLLLAVAAGVLTLVALYRDHVSRRSLLAGAGVCAIAAFIITAIFGFRFRAALDIPGILGNTQALGLANAGAGLDSGWYLAIFSSLALVALAIWGYMSDRGVRPAESVPNMEWVEPGTHQGAARDTGAARPAEPGPSSPSSPGEQR